MENELYVYKILSNNDWIESQELGYLKPQALDEDFIHLSEKQQIDRIVAKYWANQTDILIAKLDPSKFKDRLVYESNPGGTNKYYHLYDGEIPLKAVIDLFPWEEV